MFHHCLIDQKYEGMELQINLCSEILTESLSTLKMDPSTSLNSMDIESERYSNLNGQKILIHSFLYQHELKSQQSWRCHTEEGLTSTNSLETFDLSPFNSFHWIDDHLIPNKNIYVSDSMFVFAMHWMIACLDCSNFLDRDYRRGDQHQCQL